MAPVLIFAMFVISLTLQGSILALAGTNGVHPDILLVVVVALALLSDSKRGALVGLAAGLIQDILFGSPLGFFAFVMMLTGLIAGMLADEVNKEFVLAPMLLIVLFSLFSDFITYLLLTLYRIPIPYLIVEYLQHFTLPRAMMHFVFMGLIYPRLYWLQKHRLLFSETESAD